MDDDGQCWSEVVFCGRRVDRLPLVDLDGRGESF